MVKIRLKRTGKKNDPCYRIVVADVRSPRDGRNIETIGLYDPRRDSESIQLDRVDYWLGVGAQPTSTVADLIRRAKTGEAKVAGTKVAEEAPAVEAEVAATEEA